MIKNIKTRKDFLELVFKSSPELHYFRQTNGKRHSYLRKAFECIKSILERSRFHDKVLLKKLQLTPPLFNENQFLQDICELTIASFYANEFGSDFTYERKISSKKDVDFSFRAKVIFGDYGDYLDEEVHYNFEVKCPDADKSSIHQKDTVEIHPFTRFPSKEGKEIIVTGLINKLEPSGLNVIEKNRKDNKLKDYLLSMQEKCINTTDNDINTLIVCCDNATDMMKWREYLWGAGGFFTNTRPISHKKYDKVDVVVLTNTFHRHHKIFLPSKNTISDPWDFSKSFNLAYINPTSHNKWRIAPLKLFIPDLTESFESYFYNDSDIPEGEDPLLKGVLAIAWFSDKYKSQGVYYFNE